MNNIVNKRERINDYGFYTSKKWLQRAKSIRKKYNYICQDCGKFGNYIHHINPLTQDDYINRPLMKCYGENNLTCLCFHCHEKRHTKSRVAEGVYIDKDGQVRLKEE